MLSPGTAGQCRRTLEGVPRCRPWWYDPAPAGQATLRPARTAVAHDAGEVRALAGSASALAELSARVSVCRACPRLVAWREEVARTKRRAFADQEYWGRPVPGFGDRRPRASSSSDWRPAAHGANRTGRILHRRPLAATGSTPRCTAAASPTSPPPCAADDGLG